VPVVGAFPTTISRLRLLESREGQPTQWAEMPGDHLAVLCYIDAQIAKAPPPGPTGEARDPYDRILIAVVDGMPTLLAAGYRDTLPVQAP
jgi:hypothetical protein